MNTPIVHIQRYKRVAEISDVQIKPVGDLSIWLPKICHSLRAGTSELSRLQEMAANVRGRVKIPEITVNAVK